MAIRDIFKVNFKTFVNPSGWLGLSSLKYSTRSIVAILKGLFVLPATGKAETFDEAVARFNLTEADLKEREKDYLFYAGIFLVLGLVSFVFGFYLLFVKRKFLDCLLGIAVAALFGTQGFRYHFWYFLIKQRKLGCTFDDWLVFIKWNKPVAHK